MIKAQDLYFSYTGAKPYVLSGLNFELTGGEYVSVVGDNGSGKSTLVKLLLGLLKPTHGTIEKSASLIGYVPQRTEDRNTAFPITVQEMLNSYRRILKLKQRSIVDDSLRQVGMEDFAGALTGTLSGGQSQKVLIARALMGAPELIVLDEPSTGVDAGSQREIYALLKKLNTEQGITIVSVEHNLVAAVQNSTLIYHLTRGSGHICTPANFAAEFTGQNMTKRGE